MPEIAIIFEKCGGQNKNNLMIHFMKMVKKGGLFGTYTFNFYINGHTKNDCDRACTSLKVLYRKQNIFTFEKCCEFLNTRNYVKVIQMFYEKCFELESSLNDLYNRPDPKTGNINHIFQVKTSRHILVIVKSSMARSSLKIVKRRKMPTSVHRGRVEPENVSNT